MVFDVIFCKDLLTFSLNMGPLVTYDLIGNTIATKDGLF